MIEGSIKIARFLQCLLSKNYNCFFPNISYLWDWNLIFLHRYPDEEVGQLPMAFVVRQNGNDDLTEDQVMEFVAKQVHTTLAWPINVLLNFLITLCIALIISLHKFLYICTYVLNKSTFIRLPLTRRYVKFVLLIQYHGCRLASYWGASCISTWRLPAGCNTSSSTTGAWRLEEKVIWYNIEMEVFVPNFHRSSILGCENFSRDRSSLWGVPARPFRYALDGVKSMNTRTKAYV